MSLILPFNERSMKSNSLHFKEIQGQMLSSKLKENMTYYNYVFYWTIDYMMQLQLCDLYIAFKCHSRSNVLRYVERAHAWFLKKKQHTSDLIKLTCHFKVTQDQILWDIFQIPLLSISFSYKLYSECVLFMSLIWRKWNPRPYINSFLFSCMCLAYAIQHTKTSMI